MGYPQLEQNQRVPNVQKLKRTPKEVRCLYENDLIKFLEIIDHWKHALIMTLTLVSIISIGSERISAKICIVTTS